jgi:hypothetical protein
LNKKLYVLGGYDGVTSLRSVEVYDPETNVYVGVLFTVIHFIISLEIKCVCRLFYCSLIYCLQTIKASICLFDDSNFLSLYKFILV